MLETKFDSLRGIDPAVGGGSSSGSVRGGTSRAVDGANGKAADGNLPVAVVEPGTSHPSKRVKKE